MENNLESEIAQSIAIQTAITAMPSLVKLYPKIIGMIDMGEKAIDDYLGSGKMIVITKKNGRTMGLVLDTAKGYTISNNFVLEGDGSAVLNKYEKTEWKNKIVNSIPLQTLKDHYEKSDKKEETTDNPILNIFNTSK